MITNDEFMEIARRDRERRTRERSAPLDHPLRRHSDPHTDPRGRTGPMPSVVIHDELNQMGVAIATSLDVPPGTMIVTSVPDAASAESLYDHMRKAINCAREDFINFIGCDPKDWKPEHSVSISGLMPHGPIPSMPTDDYIDHVKSCFTRYVTKDGIDVADYFDDRIPPGISAVTRAAARWGQAEVIDGEEDHPDNTALVPLKPMIRRSPQYLGRSGRQAPDTGSALVPLSAQRGGPGVGDQLQLDLKEPRG